MVATDGRGGWRLSAWCVIAAFGAYFCMYAFRKPFTAGLYTEVGLWGIQTKVLLVTAQAIGYSMSKMIGVKVVAEMPAGRRVACLLGLIAAAEAALLLFALTPSPYNIFFLFLNGLPLGMVFGLVLWFLEGRRHTEALTAGLCTSFIIADGVMNTVGTYLMEAGLTETWMPFGAGLLFVPPLLLFAWMLSRIPAPSPADVAARSERAPMGTAERRAFYGRYALGLSLLMLVFLLVTVLRSVRSNFQPELWRGLGVVPDANAFVISETTVGLAVLFLTGLMVCIKDNRSAFFGALALSIAGLALIGAALIGLGGGLLSPLGFMVLHGLGLYLPYVVFHTAVFERLIALTRDRGTLVYLLGLADAVGYLGFTAIMLVKNRVGTLDNFLDFFVPLSWVGAVTGVLLLLASWRYFAIHTALPSRKAELEPIEA
jgi:Family of unknown function (DUF5690)